MPVYKPIIFYLMTHKSKTNLNPQNFSDGKVSRNQSYYKCQNFECLYHHTLSLEKCTNVDKEKLAKQFTLCISPDQSWNSDKQWMMVSPLTGEVDPSTPIPVADLTRDELVLLQKACRDALKKERHFQQIERETNI